MSEEQENSTETAENNNEASLKTDLQKAKNDYLYLLADFDNYRKNAIKERSDLVKYGSERFIREFLGVFDNLERALSTDVGPENVDRFREGLQMIAGEFRTLLKNFGVEEIPAEGQAFDPNQHEALSSEPRDDIKPGHIAQVFRKAYKMHDKLIRPAQVTVASAPPKG
jgi:molecular chaperone GrpE